MAELYTYNMVLYWKFSGLRHWYNTYYTVMTNYTRDPLHRSVSYQPNSYSDPALDDTDITIEEVQGSKVGRNPER